MNIKRKFDVAVSLTGIVVSLPLLLAGTFASAAAHKSFPFYSQQRVGKDGELFTIFKIKSMHNWHDEFGNLLANEDRLTEIGKILRKSRIDELPQFFNILKGDMSLVGPRPLMPSDLISQDSIRIRVLPGCTGLAQIHGHNTLTPAMRLNYDKQYVEELTQRDEIGNFINDIKIILKSSFYPLINGIDPK
ncbi:MAG: sugar transferase [Alphaproteobacteria bacterium]